MIIHRLTIIAIFTLFGIGSFGTSHAGSNKNDYDLQERCGKQAEESFRREWGEGVVNMKSGMMTADYSNHYNKKMNKCFVLLSVSTMHQNNASKSIMLYDINESRTYGQFFQSKYDLPPNMCHVLDKNCSSEDEWKSLVRSYMEE